MIFLSQLNCKICVGAVPEGAASCLYNRKFRWNYPLYKKALRGVQSASGACYAPTEVERRRTAAEWKYVAKAIRRRRRILRAGFYFYLRLK